MRESQSSTNYLVLRARRAFAETLRNIKQRSQIVGDDARAHGVSQMETAEAASLETGQGDSEETIWQGFQLRGLQVSDPEPDTQSPKLETGNPIWVDARPERVEARESYAYQLTGDSQLPAGFNVRSMGHPSGEVRVEVPYDGFRHFPLEVARRLREQALVPDTGTVNGQMGWLAIGSPLDWERDWSRPIGVETIPVYIPLRGEELLRDELWAADEVRAVVQHTYTPENLPFWPLSIDLQVYDDASAPSGTLPGAWGESLRDYLARTSSHRFESEGQVGQLAMDFIITVFIPAILARKKVSVELECLELEWPSVATPWQLEIYRPQDTESLSQGAKGCRSQAWRYNPDRRVVEVRNVAASRGEPEAGSPLVPYVCELRFLLRSPGQVIAQDEARGVVRMSLEGVLLSGREVAWLGVSGHRHRLAGPPKSGQYAKRQHTVLEAEFSASLSDQFDHRRTATYRRWYFPGVSLSADRLGDVAAALQALGYRVQNYALCESEPEAYGLLVATRLAPLQLTRSSSEPTTLQLEILAERAAAIRTRREREIPEGIRISTEVETSDLVLHVRGQLRGPASVVASDMDQLMTMLKKRLAAMADLR